MNYDSWKSTDSERDTQCALDDKCSALEAQIDNALSGHSLCVQLGPCLVDVEQEYFTVEVNLRVKVVAGAAEVCEALEMFCRSVRAGLAKRK